MKKFIKKLPLAAFVFVLVGLFAFSTKSSEEAVSVVWFQLSPLGDVMSEIDDPEDICTEGEAIYCAVSVSTTDLDSSGLPQFENVEEAGASNHYEDIAKRDN